MEVHKHPHGVTHKKKWTEYLLEFLMIFLAVTMGFIAENIREETVNHKKEREFVKNMLKDLVSDTSELADKIKFSATMASGLDSLSNALYSANGSDSSTLQIYRMQGEYLRIIGVDFNDATSIELRNSGGMQVIRNGEVRIAIARYWQRISVIKEIEERYNAQADVDFSFGIFNKNYQHIRARSDAGILTVEVDRGAQFMTNDKNQLINYANRMRRKVNIVNNFLMNNLTSQKKEGIGLIKIIKRDYHLD
jgi:hypothetical protein